MAIKIDRDAYGVGDKFKVSTHDPGFGRGNSKLPHNAPSVTALPPFTPGPWAIMRGSRGTLNQPKKDWTPFIGVQTNLVKNGPEASLCEMTLNGPPYGPIDGRFRSISDAEAEANARLMSAAPDLYSAAMNALVYMQSLDSGDRGKAIVDELIKALATAAE